jgi:RNA polymerase sigma-70 factor, ECF subfamily
VDESRRQFVRLITRYERLVYGYILGMVPNWADADEILQETNIRLWEEFEKFVPGTNFAAWAIRVAHFQVLTWRKQTDRRRLVFGHDVIEAIAEEPSWADDSFESRQQALVACVGELPARSRDLLRQCYAQGGTIKDVAARSNRSAGSVYKALERIRELLHSCIEHKLAEE